MCKGWDVMGGVNFLDSPPELGAVGFLVYGVEVGKPVCCLFFSS